ncbi:MAG: nuclear transport factor 2 family protein [Actinobacteria bacterium]|nr:nuclear transport factor 2 family protein [Actinomycetota bacterium]
MGALKRSMEEKDLEGLLARYADDAEITSVDRNTPPSAPRRLKGKSEIRKLLADVCGRAMTHHVDRTIVGDGVASFVETCAYPDGTNVVCMATLEYDASGRITRQFDISTWDG